jgi:hypothetical protein
VCAEARAAGGTGGKVRQRSISIFEIGGILMAARKKQAPRVEITELRRDAEELTQQEAESVRGGIIAVLIGLKSQPATAQEETDIIVGAGAGAPGGHVK